MAAIPPHALYAFLEGVRDAGGARVLPVDGRPMVEGLDSPPCVDAQVALQRLQTHLVNVVLPPLLERIGVHLAEVTPDAPSMVGVALWRAQEAAGVTGVGRWADDSRGGAPHSLWPLVISIKSCLMRGQASAQGFAAYDIGRQMCRARLGDDVYGVRTGPLWSTIAAMTTPTVAV